MTPIAPSRTSAALEASSHESSSSSFMSASRSTLSACASCRGSVENVSTPPKPPTREGRWLDGEPGEPPPGEGALAIFCTWRPRPRCGVCGG